MAEILKDQTVAWDGYKARVCYSPVSCWWGWDASRSKEVVAAGCSPTEPAARESLAGWLLDNTLKEDKR